MKEKCATTLKELVGLMNALSVIPESIHDSDVLQAGERGRTFPFCRSPSTTMSSFESSNHQSVARQVMTRPIMLTCTKTGL